MFSVVCWWLIWMMWWVVIIRLCRCWWINVKNNRCRLLCSWFIFVIISVLILWWILVLFWKCQVCLLMVWKVLGCFVLKCFIWIVIVCWMSRSNLKFISRCYWWWVISWLFFVWWILVVIKVFFIWIFFRKRICFLVIVWYVFIWNLLVCFVFNCGLFCVLLVLVMFSWWFWWFIVLIRFYGWKVRFKKWLLSLSVMVCVM